MKVLVTGANGQLGSDVMLELQKQGLQAIGTTLQDCDLTQEAQVRQVISSHQPDAILHCAAYTAVDKAEKERELCFRVNREGSRFVAEAAEAIGARVLYVSTDYVFDGTSSNPYEVHAPTNPLNVYGASKLAGEIETQKACSRAFVVRTSWVFGRHGHNFVKTMLRLAQTRDSLSIVNDQLGSPTYTPDLAALLVTMIQTEHYGTYHATNEGVCSWFEFAREIFEQTQTKLELSPIPTRDYPTPAQRPQYSALSKQSLDTDFARLPSWQEALRRYFAAK